MELSREDLKVIAATGVSREAFIAERQREEAEGAKAQTTGRDGDGLSAEDQRVLSRCGTDRKAFVETRRLFGTT